MCSTPTNPSVANRPPFALGRDWRRRASHSSKIDHRVWYDPETGYEYERDPRPRPAGATWHEIDSRTDRNRYRDLDALTGEPVAGSEGQWRPLQ
jgi:hypothetical protein